MYMYIYEYIHVCTYIRHIAESKKKAILKYPVDKCVRQQQIDIAQS